MMYHQKLGKQQKMEMKALINFSLIATMPLIHRSEFFRFCIIDVNNKVIQYRHALLYPAVTTDVTTVM